MEVQVLGVSGSPVPDSNTDRAVKLVLNHTGLRTRFVKLSELRLEPCRGCLGCVENNQCTVDDDGRSLAEAFRTASAFVLGAFTPYNSLDARSKMFMERMYCLRHQTGRNSGKFGAYVITTACPPYGSNVPPAFETATSQIRSWMAEEGILEIGGMLVVGNVPCIRCGHGDACMVSGIKLIHGSEASIASVGIQRFEDDPLAEDNAKQLALQVRRAVLGNLDAPAG